MSISPFFMEIWSEKQSFTMGKYVAWASGNGEFVRILVYNFFALGKKIQCGNFPINTYEYDQESRSFTRFFLLLRTFA